MQVRSAYNGGHLVNEAAPFLYEYSLRKRLAKLGFTSSFDSLDAFKADVFCLIDSEIDAVQAKDIKKKKKK